MSNRSYSHLGSYPKHMRTQLNQGSQNNPPGYPDPPQTLLSPSSTSALPSPSHIQQFLPDTGCYFQLQPSLWTRSCFLGAARSWAQPFGILPTTSSQQLCWCEPYSSLTSASTVLCSDAVATDSVSSGHGLCERGRSAQSRREGSPSSLEVFKTWLNRVLDNLM